MAVPIKVQSMPKVLYVEDSTTSQLLMRRLLSDVCELSIVSTLAQAEAALFCQSFDLLIADYLFPQGDTPSFIATIRRQFSREKLPIIVVSSAMDSLLLSQLIKMGVNDGLPKPLHPVDFKALVGKMLHEPYVRTPEHTLVAIRCFQWFADGKYHQHCPELGLTITDADKASLAKQMHQAIEQAFSLGKALGETTQESVVTHLFSMPSRLGGAEANR